MNWHFLKFGDFVIMSACLCSVMEGPHRKNRGASGRRAEVQNFISTQSWQHSRQWTMSLSTHWKVTAGKCAAIVYFTRGYLRPPTENEFSLNFNFLAEWRFPGWVQKGEHLRRWKKLQQHFRTTFIIRRTRFGLFIRVITIKMCRSLIMSDNLMILQVLLELFDFWIYCIIQVTFQHL